MPKYGITYSAMDRGKSYLGEVAADQSEQAIRLVARRHNIPEGALSAEWIPSQEEIEAANRFSGEGAN